MSEVRLEYGQSVVALPKDRLLEAMSGADMEKMRVLLLLASDEGLRGDYDKARAEITARLDITGTAFDKDIEFWSAAGVISLAGAADEKAPQADLTAKVVPAEPDSAKTKPEPKPETARGGKGKPLMPSALPTYTESQCADIISASPDLADVTAMCQQIVGKIFTPADIAVIVTMYDHLGLGGEYIVTLFSYLSGKGKNSLRYIERTAVNLFDEGVDTVDDLNAYIKRKDEFEDNVGKIRSLIGAGQRELTAKEKKCFTCWLDEWCFPIDVITRAYEVTVDKIGDPSVSYMNKVLENWKNSGLTTLGAVEASLENYKKKKAEAAHGTETVNGAESGFQTDEFFEAALRRSYRGAGNPEDIPAAKG